MAALGLFLSQYWPVFGGVLERLPSLRVAFAQELVAWGCGAEAAAQLDAACGDHPDEPRLALLAGRVLAGESRLDEAAAALERAARGLSGGERAEAWFWLMGVRRDQGDHTTAETRLLEALELQRGDELISAGLHLALAKLYEHNLRDPGRALEHAGRCADIEGIEANVRRRERLSSRLGQVR